MRRVLSRMVQRRNVASQKAWEIMAADDDGETPCRLSASPQSALIDYPAGGMGQRTPVPPKPQ